jgi:hypothetical protein
MRLAAAAAVLLLASLAAAKGAKNRTRPSSTKIKAPKGLAAIKVPEGVPAAPPADHWWDATPPCSDGATLHIDPNDVTRYACRDGEGQEHGPYTEIEQNGALVADGWRKHGTDHGVARRFHGGSEYERKTYVDGELLGPATESPGSTGSYRKGERHGYWEERTLTGTRQLGYYDRGRRVGTWLAVITHRGETLVVGRAQYTKGQLDGEVVWWAERGDVLATITKRFSDVTWRLGTTTTILCDGDRLLQVQVKKKGDLIACSYDETLRGLGTPDERCPASNQPAEDICRADLLDPWAVADIARRATAY